MTARVHLLLAFVVAVYVVLGLAFAARTPLWQAPDEPAHFNYVRHLAEGRGFPVLQPGDYDAAYLERLKSTRFPPDLPVDGVRYEGHQPPFYYVLALPLYLSVRSLPLAQQVFVLRLFSVFLGALVLLAAYRTARLVFPQKPLLAVAVPALVAALPQHLAMTAALNNDTLGELVLSLLLLSLLSSVPAPITGLLLGLALLTKTNIYVALALVPLGLWLRSAAAPSPAKLLPPLLIDRLAVIHVVALLLSGWWFVRNVLVYGGLDLFGWQRHDLVVVGQPRTVPGWEAVGTFLAVTFRSFWVQIGWMAVPADDRTYWFLGLLSGIGVLGAAIFTLRLLRPAAPGANGRAVLLLAATLGLVFLTMAQYNLRYVQPQGRYLFYAIVPLAVLFVGGMQELERRQSGRYLLALLVGALGLFVLLQLRDLVPLSVEPLLFAALAALTGALALGAGREILWPRFGVPPALIGLGSVYLALLVLDVVVLLRMVPLLD